MFHQFVDVPAVLTADGASVRDSVEQIKLLDRDSVNLRFVVLGACNRCSPLTYLVKNLEKKTTSDSKMIKKMFAPHINGWDINSAKT